MKKLNLTYVFVGILIFVFIVALIYVMQRNNISNEVCVNEEERVCFNIEIAESIEEKTKGLMFREVGSLKENEGMLFVFDENGVYDFWMKDTLISLDMIWISEDGKIVYIKENATPLSEEIITPSSNALYVLEVNAGIVEKYGFEIGDVMEISS